MREEIDRCMGYCGQADIRELEAALVNIPTGWGVGTLAP